ncbi:MAG: hypothetical protein ACXW2Q_11295 [Thermoanaerobaculia bacterium]
MRTRFLAPILLFACWFVTPVARAGCGSSSCPLDLHALGLTDTSRFVFDLSFQYIDQDRLRHASGDFEIEHDERRTINRITIFQFSSLITPRFQLSVVAPYVGRSHEHIERESGELERWRFGAFGDASVQGRYRVFRGSVQNGDSLWLSAGIKLPTGAKHEESLGPEPEEAEVTIQPGTGSTDIVLGATFQGGIVRNAGVAGPMGSATLIPWFASVAYRRNGSGTLEYRRGDELQVSVGSEYPVSRALHVIGQVNVRHTAKDEVGSTNENPELTGGTYVYLSPGLRFVAGHGFSTYGYVQLPAVQRVNGVQLTSRVNYLFGIQQRF